jgi:hypothetical protein
MREVCRDQTTPEKLLSKPDVNLRSISSPIDLFAFRLLPLLDSFAMACLTAETIRAQSDESRGAGVGRGMHALVDQGHDPTPFA